MTFEQTILFSDLDGTLFNSQGVVTPENQAAIAHYIAGGGMFAIATGREPQNALSFIGDLPQNAPAVVINGCAVYDFAREEYLQTWFMDRARLLPFLRELLGAVPALELQCYTERGIRYCTPRETAHPQLLAMHTPCEFTTLDALEAAGASFFKCFLYAPDRFEEELMARFRAGEAAGIFRHVPGTTDVGGPITYHELLPPEASKGLALRWLRTQPGIAGRTVIAAGDFWNDYELLAEADVSVAPENAIDEIKALCTHGTVSNNDHVIKHIVEDLIPTL